MPTAEETLTTTMAGKVAQRGAAGTGRTEKGAESLSRQLLAGAGAGATQNPRRGRRGDKTLTTRAHARKERIVRVKMTLLSSRVPVRRERRRQRAVLGTQLHNVRVDDGMSRTYAE